MKDRSWMLNPKAIRAAKECINIVKDELGVKLTLSHDEFMHMLYEYVDLTDSIPLADAYANLLELSGVGGKEASQKVRRKVSGTGNVVPLLEDSVEPKKAPIKNEYVEFKGKTFPRFHNGKEFKGLYRGQPRYA